MHLLFCLYKLCELDCVYQYHVIWRFTLWHINHIGYNAEYKTENILKVYFPHTVLKKRTKQMDLKVIFEKIKLQNIAKSARKKIDRSPSVLNSGAVLPGPRRVQSAVNTSEHYHSASTEEGWKQTVFLPWFAGVAEDCWRWAGCQLVFVPGSSLEGRIKRTCWSPTLSNHCAPPKPVRALHI